jgi:hypothetical protein
MKKTRCSTSLLYYNREFTIVVAALAAPQTPNPTRNPNPTKKKKKKKREP